MFVKLNENEQPVCKQNDGTAVHYDGAVSKYQ